MTLPAPGAVLFVSFLSYFVPSESHKLPSASTITDPVS